MKSKNIKMHGGNLENTTADRIKSSLFDSITQIKNYTSDIASHPFLQNIKKSMGFLDESEKTLTSESKQVTQQVASSFMSQDSIDKEESDVMKPSEKYIQQTIDSMSRSPSFGGKRKNTKKQLRKSRKVVRKHRSRGKAKSKNKTLKHKK